MQKKRGQTKTTSVHQQVHQKPHAIHNFTQHINRRKEERNFRRMLVVLKPIKCELEIAKGVRAKGEASVTERDVVFNAAEKSSYDESSA